MKIFSSENLSELSRFTRANLVNCLTGIKPAILIGTKSESGISNLGLFSSVFHLGADPAMIGFVQRPLTDFSHTYKNIITTGAYTMNLVSTNAVAQAHHTSAKFANDESEFSACGFSEKEIGGFYAPFVESCSIQFGLQFIREIYIPENDTRLMVGNITIVAVDENALEEDGNLNLENAQSVGSGGLETYYSLQRLSKFAYAKPGVLPIDLLR
jgi:hypothetical protein